MSKYISVKNKTQKSLTPMKKICILQNKIKY